jgi:hypothetical protein
VFYAVAVRATKGHDLDDRETALGHDLDERETALGHDLGGNGMRHSEPISEVAKQHDLDEMRGGTRARPWRGTRRDLGMYEKQSYLQKELRVL